MEQRLPKIQRFRLCSAIFFSLLFMFSHASTADEIIANASVEQAELSNDQLQSIFGLRLRTWPDGSPITVYVLPDNHPLHDRFCKRVLNVFPYQMRRAWNRFALSGTGQTPIELTSEAEMIEKVATTPGAIGYVKKSKPDKRIQILSTY